MEGRSEGKESALGEGGAAAVVVSNGSRLNELHKLRFKKSSASGAQTRTAYSAIETAWPWGEVSGRENAKSVLL